MGDLWAGFARVSDMGSRKSGADNFHSEREQEEAMRRMVRELGGRLELLASELDVSGGKPLEARPSLLRAVEGVEGGRYRGIVMAYQSRLTRQPEVEEEVYRRVEAAGGSVRFATGDVDNLAVDGRMMRRVSGVINARYREEATERFDRDRARAIAAGIWKQPQTPKGYRRNSETRRLEPDDSAPLVRWAFEARAQGVSVLDIARRLDNMTPSGVRALLRNRVYLGELREGQVRKYENLTAHPALIDEETWRAAQVSVARPARAKGSPALLAGLMRCASCGHAMTRNGRSYQCQPNHSGGRCPAPASVMTHRVEAYVLTIAHDELKRVRLTASEGDAVEVARRALVEAQDEVRATVRRFRGTKLPDELVREEVDAAQVVADEREAVLQAAIARRPAVPVALDGVQALDELDGHAQNRVLRALIGAVVVAPARGDRRAPVEGRVRVLEPGPLVGAVKRGGEAAGIVPVPFDDLYDDRLMWPAGRESASELVGGRA